MEKFLGWKEQSSDPWSITQPPALLNTGEEQQFPCTSMHQYFGGFVLHVLVREPEETLAICCQSRRVMEKEERLRYSARLWISIPKPSMYLPHAPRPRNPSADKQHKAGQQSQQVPLGMRRDGEMLNVLSHHLLLPPCPSLLCAGHPWGSSRHKCPKGAGGGDMLGSAPPPRPVHAGAPARRCVYRRCREAGGSRSHASRMWLKKQVPTSLTLTVPALLRGQPDLPLIYSDHKTNGLNKTLHD
ncbi:uncharacterized protein LOC119153902 isoform X1 [Falco rusticolus]|uniref:uncharacterized protein LOC119153902 isoform X1 n=1 Tax=Falco rusticolus TaxID=120794 RepID=UPI0018865A50|nr:uncharacterized protein LOC119153902 isoform X1 [Falco rusticolus]